METKKSNPSSLLDKIGKIIKEEPGNENLCILIGIADGVVEQQACMWFHGLFADLSKLLGVLSDSLMQEYYQMVFEDPNRKGGNA